MYTALQSASNENAQTDSPGPPVSLEGRDEVEDSKKTQVGILVRFLEMVEGEIDRLLDEEKSKVEGGSEANNAMEDLEDAAVGIEEAIDSLRKAIAANEG